MTSTGRLCWAAVLVLLPATTSYATTIDASVDVWLRETGPDRTFETDLVSVWSESGNDNGRRYGVLEFDVSSLAGRDLPGLQLNLYGHANSFSDDVKPVNQVAFLINTTGGTPAADMTWNAYQAEYAAGAVALNGLGRLVIDAPTPTGQFFGSLADPADLALIEAVADSANPTLTLVLQMVEDGTDYAHSWSDGPDGFSGTDGRGGNAPSAQLVVVPEPATSLLMVLGAVALVALRRRN